MKLFFCINILIIIDILMFVILVSQFSIYLFFNYIFILKNDGKRKKNECFFPIFLNIIMNIVSKTTIYVFFIKLLFDILFFSFSLIFGLSIQLLEKIDKIYAIIILMVSIILILIILLSCCYLFIFVNSFFIEYNAIFRLIMLISIISFIYGFIIGYYIYNTNNQYIYIITTIVWIGINIFTELPLLYCLYSSLSIY